jgi:hypothetical protein
MPKGYINMEKFREMENFLTALGIKMAVVQLKLGESPEEAWNRHLKENPDDALATLRIFQSSYCLNKLKLAMNK